MSHSHRDENDLAEPVVQEPAPVLVVPPAPVVTNSDAERRAAERRKAEGVPEQSTQHQFTGDLPEPHAGGTDIETRVTFADAADDDDDARAQAAAARRGAPPPRALFVDDESSWAAPPLLDALGAGSLAVANQSWLAPADDPEAAALGTPTDALWHVPTST